MKLRSLFRPIPKPVRACLWAAAALTLAVAYYIALGCPTFTMRQEFRRAEKVHMVGPSKIVDNVLEYYDFQQMLVGETEYGICFFGKYGTSIHGGKHTGEKHYSFSYQEKTGDITLAVAPNVFGGVWNQSGTNLPVYIFTEHKDAARAEIEIHIAGQRTRKVNGKDIIDPYQEVFQETATRSKKGYFRFFLDCADEDGGYALDLLSDLVSGNGPIFVDDRTATIQATVRLYDANDQLILTKEMDLSPAAKE